MHPPSQLVRDFRVRVRSGRRAQIGWPNCYCCHCVRIGRHPQHFGEPQRSPSTFYPASCKRARCRLTSYLCSWAFRTRTANRYLTTDPPFPRQRRQTTSRTCLATHPRPSSSSHPSTHGDRTRNPLPLPLQPHSKTPLQTWRQCQKRKGGPRRKRHHYERQPRGKSQTQPRHQEPSTARRPSRMIT